MLTVTQPIGLVLRGDFIQSNDSFANRIIGNYNQMHEMITAEDLLHVVTQPPEIFLMDGGGSMFLSETAVHNEQRNKVEIINNVINRILLAADGHMTYQDEVYITNVLHKLGIHEDKVFMEQVFKLTEETKQTNKLVATYLNNRESLTELISNYKSSYFTDEHSSEQSNVQEILHLHEDVFKRWMAGQVYNTLNEFGYSPENHYEVTKESYQMAEQSRLVQQMLLQSLREEVRGETVPLVYRHENIYEGDDVTTEEINEQSVTERLSAAVLLSMVDHIYQTTYPRVDHSHEHQYSVENTFYQAGDNTFERIFNNTDYRQALYEEARIAVNEQSAVSNEYQILQKILETPDNRTFENNISFEENEFSPVTMENIAGDEIQVTEETTVDERNSIEQQLYQTNRQNIERQQTYIRNLANLVRNFEADSVRTPEEVRERQLEALEHPQEFARRIEEENRQQEARRREFESAAEALLPQDTQVVFSMIRQYLNRTDNYNETNLIGVNNEALLYYDTQLAENPEVRLIDEERIVDRERRLIEQRQLTQEILTETIEREAGDITNELQREINNEELVYRDSQVEERRQVERATEERILESQRRIIEGQRIAGELLNNVTREVEEERGTPETIYFSHRTTENTFNEETISELQRQLKRHEQTTRQLSEEVKNIETSTERTINNIRNEVTNIPQTDTYAEEATQKIEPRQINMIAEKVYSRIERQLSNERRRRGL